MRSSTVAGGRLESSVLWCSGLCILAAPSFGKTLHLVERWRVQVPDVWLRPFGRGRLFMCTQYCGAILVSKLTITNFDEGNS